MNEMRVCCNTPIEAHHAEDCPERIVMRDDSSRIKMYEEVNHPDHYNQHPSGIECIDVIEQMSFPIGNVIKHLWRSGLKPGMDHRKDLMKAHWYLTRELQRLEREGRGTDEAALRFSVDMQHKGIMDLYPREAPVAIHRTEA